MGYNERIYEVPVGVCGDWNCPDEDMDCWMCTLKGILQYGTEGVCGCNHKLCAICNLKGESNEDQK